MVCKSRQSVLQDFICSLFFQSMRVVCWKCVSTPIKHWLWDFFLLDFLFLFPRFWCNSPVCTFAQANPVNDGTCKIRQLRQKSEYELFFVFFWRVNLVKVFVSLKLAWRAKHQQDSVEVLQPAQSHDAVWLGGFWSFQNKQPFGATLWSVFFFPNTVIKQHHKQPVKEIHHGFYQTTQETWQRKQ